MGESRQSEVTRTIVANIRRLRRERGWSAQEVAERCSRQASPRKNTLTRVRLSKLESGVVANFYDSELVDLADVFGVSLDQLMRPLRNSTS